MAASVAGMDEWSNTVCTGPAGTNGDTTIAATLTPYLSKPNCEV
jgi:hypothetical protein